MNHFPRVLVKISEVNFVYILKFGELKSPVCCAKSLQSLFLDLLLIFGIIEKEQTTEYMFSIKGVYVSL